MTKPNIEFCEDKIDNLGTFNVLSNIFIILGGFYGILLLKNVKTSINYMITECVFIMVGLGSMYFHYKKDFFSELFDELPMSILIICYFLIAGIKESKFLHLGFILFTVFGWIIYLFFKDFHIFEKMFILQIIYLVLILFKNYKTSKQLFFYIASIIIIGISKLLWNYEQKLLKNDNCPLDSYNLIYYLHSYWHIGVAISHVLLMHGLRM